MSVEPINVTARITQAGKPVRAKVALRYGRNVPETETDANGRYSLRVWNAGRYQLEVTPAEPVSTEPHLDMLLIGDDMTVDVDLPSNRLSVQVIDEGTKKPIAGAVVAVHSARPGGRTLRSVRTNARGIAVLPPVYRGELTLHATAENYFEGTPINMMISDATGERQIALALHRAEETVSLALVLPNGAPAAGAEAIAVRDPHTTLGPLWNGRADQHGILGVPQSLNGAFLAVRHEAAAGTIRMFPSGETWTLRPPAPIAGDWIDGLHVGAGILAFLKRN
ncbi:MAG TPA: carboxypeptidase-like regulatory domain-containing protein [Thermoanaerobaculia bacterium]|nr:carboxypeptidase-like regulatory domain-containing protein [Thermoanaerobaculia bacterium]